MTPTISVVVPHHNQHRYIGECIASIAAQTLKPLEIVIVDDGSQPPLAADMSWAPEGIGGVLVWLAENRGTPAALNAGIRKARGETIAVVHGDDILEPWYLERMAPHLGPHFCYGDLRLHINGERAAVLRMPAWDFEKAKRRSMAHGAILFPKAAWEAVGGYPEAMRDGREDWAMTLRLAHGGYPGRHVDGEPGYLYRQHGDNRSLGNHTPEWAARFAAQIRDVLPEVYA